MNIRFFNGTILTLENGTELSSGEVWVFDHLIGYVGKPQDNNIKWDREINLNGNLIMPGFKDAHTHSAMTFYVLLLMICHLTDGLTRRFFQWKPS